MMSGWSERIELFFIFSPALECDAKQKEKHMKQKQLYVIPELLSSASVVKAAAVDKAAGIPLLHNTTVHIGTDADALTTACNNHDEGKVVLATNRSLLATIIVTVRLFLTLGRDILKPVLGYEYSQAFDVVGLIKTIAIPRTAEELLFVLQKFQAYFTAHPELEDESRNITAAQAEALHGQLLTALNNVNSQVGAVQTLAQLRDAAAEQMRKRIRGVIDEMMGTLDPFDGRWLAFGFNMPGAQETPDVPENLMVTVIGPGTAASKWDASARADHYRIWMKIHGTNDDYVAVGSRAELDFTLENLPAGSTIDIAVSAVNDGGESQLSNAVTITTHA